MINPELADELDAIAERLPKRANTPIDSNALAEVLEYVRKRRREVHHIADGGRLAQEALISADIQLGRIKDLHDPVVSASAANVRRELRRTADVLRKGPRRSGLRRQ